MGSKRMPAKLSQMPLAGTALCEDMLAGDSLRRLSAAGYQCVYPCDLFSVFEPSGSESLTGVETIIADASFRVSHRPLSEAAELKDAIGAAGLSAVSAHFMETLPPPGKSREWIYPVHERFLETAAAAGLSFVTTHVGAMFAMPEGGRSFLERCSLARGIYGEARMLKDSVAVYKSLCREAAARGIAVSVETGCIELPAISHDIESLLAFIDAVGADNLGVCIDAGHCNLREMPLPEIVRRCGSRLFEVHAHDNCGDVDSHAPIGTGTVPWLPFAGALEESGYSGAITVEQRDYETSAAAWREIVKSL